MVARIYKPSRTAMQSGTAKTKEWVLEYEPEAPRVVEPLMGRTSSSDTKQQIRRRFDSERLLRMPRYSVSSVRAQGAGAPHYRVLRQLCFQSTDSLDALRRGARSAVSTW
jgi:NADH dehydrogenase ubiquinone Fe-S protein 4